MDRLIVKNFGPLKDIDIELNKINLFIGENGSGKSVLGKLITVLYNLADNIESKKESIIEELSKYNINYITNKTLIQLESYDNDKQQHNIITIKDYEVKLGDMINNLKSKVEEFNEIEKNFYENRERLQSTEKRLEYIKTNKKNIENFLQEIESLENEMRKLHTDFSMSEKLIENTKEQLYKLQTKYIPSERNFVSIISQSLSSFIVAEIPLPKYFIQFASNFENGANKIKELKVLNVHYKYGDGLDRHKVYFDEKNYLPLNESSSGIQAIIPLLVTYKYFIEKYYTIVIEEPEQNLFPKAQKEVVDFLIENLQEDNNLFLMTHSPYILTALNNLILANDIKEAKGEEAIKGIVDVSQCIPFENINAYYIEDGKAKNIMDKDNRLIGVNVIDEISDEVNETFDILLSKLD